MRKWLPLFSVALGAFMLLIDVSIVNVALPSMTTALHASFTQLQWVIDIYALALAALLLGLGSLSDLVGRKPVYIAGLVVFALASVAAGLASDTTTLIAARGVQGIGGAAMFATTIALLGSAYRVGTGPLRSASGARSTARRQPPARSSADCSPRRSRGAGCSSSTCRSACSRSSSASAC